MAATDRHPTWSQEKQDRFKQLWNDGAPVKVIAHELGLPLDHRGRNGSIQHWRLKLGLPDRRSKIAKENSACRQIRIPNEIWDKLHARSLQRGVTISAYVRYLIRRDLGISAEQDYRPMPKHQRL
jgi:hypothetical protein